MTWVRFDDEYPEHRKVAPLDDATFRLNTTAIIWCSRGKTDGRIAPHELRVIRNGTPARAAKLVERGLWHAAGDPPCPSPKCPPRGATGWTVHDFWEYQPTADKVRADIAAKAERQQRWLDKRRSARPMRDASHDESKDDAPSPSPPRRGKGTADAVPAPPAALGDGSAANDEPQTDPTDPIRCGTCGNTLGSAYHRNTCARFAPVGDVA